MNLTNLKFYINWHLVLKSHFGLVVLSFWTSYSNILGLSITLWCSCFQHCTLVLNFWTWHCSLVGLSITLWYWGFEHHTLLVLRFRTSSLENLNFEHYILVLKLQVSSIKFSLQVSNFAFWSSCFEHFTMVFKVGACIQWSWGFEHHIWH